MHKNRRPLLALLLLTTPAVHAIDYTVDFSQMDNLESLRPLVEGCEDFDSLELYRDKMTTTGDLETLRTSLAAIGLGMFLRCPDDISGPGISAVKQAGYTPPDYTVDFTRVEDFETLRPLVQDCSEFGGLENIRGRLENAADLNELRATLVTFGFGMFDECPDGIAGKGITHTAQ